jgi:predicted nucleic acid-binding protein
MDRILLDTGPLVALFNAGDALHEAADAWFAGCRAQLHTVEPVLTEVAFFLPARQRAALADLAASGVVRVHQPDTAGRKRIGALLRKYTDLDADWADACLIWAAEATGIHRIATIDVRDFSTYRIHGRTRFMIEALA